MRLKEITIATVRVPDKNKKRDAADEQEILRWRLYQNRFRTLAKLAMFPDEHPMTSDLSTKRWVWIARAGCQLSVLTISLAVLICFLLMSSSCAAKSKPEYTTVYNRTLEMSKHASFCSDKTLNMNVSYGVPKKASGTDGAEYSVRIPAVVGEIRGKVKSLEQFGVYKQRQAFYDAQISAYIKSTNGTFPCSATGRGEFICSGPGRDAYLVIRLRPGEMSRRKWWNGLCPVLKKERSCLPLILELSAPFGAEKDISRFFSIAAIYQQAIEESFLRQDGIQQVSGAPSLDRLREYFDSEEECTASPLAHLAAEMHMLLSESRSILNALYGGGPPRAVSPDKAFAARENIAKLLNSLPMLRNLAKKAKFSLASADHPYWDAHLSLLQSLYSMDFKGSGDAERNEAAYWIAAFLSGGKDRYKKWHSFAPELTSVNRATDRRDAVFAFLSGQDDIWLTGDGWDWTMTFPPGVARPRFGCNQLCYGTDSAIPVPDVDSAVRFLRRELNLDQGKIQMCMDKIHESEKALKKASELLCESDLDAECLQEYLADSAAVGMGYLKMKTEDDAPAGLGNMKKELKKLITQFNYRAYGGKTEESAPDRSIKKGMQLQECIGQKQKSIFSEAVRSAADKAMCDALDPKTLKDRLDSVYDYARYVKSAKDILDFAPTPGELMCNGQSLDADAVRARFREAYGRLVNNMGGCANERASTIQKAFGLESKQIANPVFGPKPDNHELEFPPPMHLYDSTIDGWCRGCGGGCCGGSNYLANKFPKGHFIAKNAQPRLSPELSGTYHTLNSVTRAYWTKSVCRKAEFEVRWTRESGAGPVLFISSKSPFRAGGQYVNGRIRINLDRYSGRSGSISIIPTQEIQSFKFYTTPSK